MASRRFASSVTFSVGTKMNSASLSTNFLINHGHATRSTLTYSRVIHFMRHLLTLVHGLTGRALFLSVKSYQRTLRRDATAAETHKFCFFSGRAPKYARPVPSARLPPCA